MNKIKNIIPILLLLMAPFFSSAEQFDVDNTIFTTWLGDPTSTMTVQWLANGDPLPACVNSNVDLKDEEGQVVQNLSVTNSLFFPGGTTYVCRLHFTNLNPDQYYYFNYPVDDKQYSFRTAPSSLEKPIVFAEGGDVGLNNKEVTKAHQMAGSWDPLFAFLGGDLAYGNGTDIQRWVNYLTRWSKHMRGPEGNLVPMLVAIGNHEVEGGYHQPDEKAPLFYSLFGGTPAKFKDGAFANFDFGDYLRIIALDTEHTGEIVEQKNFLNQSLSDGEAFKFVFPAYHVPAYPSYRPLTGPGSSLIRKEWAPLFEQYQVPIVFEHHDHAYKRTHPMLNEEVVQDDQGGVVYIGDGCWGRGSRDLDPEPRPYLAVSKASQNMIKVTLNATNASFEVYNGNGEIIDSFSVASKNPPEDVPPNANFSATPTDVTTGNTVTFEDSSSNATSWLWTFEEGTPATSNEQTPTVTYNTAGTFNVSLTASNQFGSDDEFKTEYIFVSEQSDDHTIPVKIEAEDYSNKHDNVSDKGTYIGNFSKGRWATYDLNVAQAGDYTLTLNVATRRTIPFNLTIETDHPDGTTQTLNFNAHSGDWYGYKEVVIDNVTLPAGAQTLTLTSEDNAFNLDWFKFTAEGTPPTEYVLTVNSGSGDGNYTAGAVVDLIADPAPLQQVFDKWIGDVSVVDDVNSPNITITMPASTVNVTATYVDVEYALTVNSGSGDGNYIAGTEVNISAGAAPSGQVFDNWTGNVSVDDVNSENTTVTMPASDVTLTANFVSISPGSDITIQAEDYVTKHDNVVDNGTFIGNFSNGRWITYDLNVAQAGDYTLTLNVATTRTIPFNLTIETDNPDGTSQTFSFDAHTGHWTSFEEKVIGIFTLTAGAQTITLSSEENAFNLDWFTFTSN